MNLFWSPEPITISHIPCSLRHPFSLHISCWYLTIITTLNSLFWPPSPTTHISFPSYFNSCSTTCLFHKPERYLTLIFSPSTPHFLPSMSLRQEDLVGSWVIYSFPSLPAGEIWEICGYARCCDMINCAWRENGWEAGRIRCPILSSPSDRSFCCPRSSTYCTHIPQWSHQLSCKAFVKTCDFNNAVFSMLISCSNFFQVVFITYLSTSFLLFSSFYIICFLSPPPISPPTSYSWLKADLGSVLFLVSLSTSLAVLE